MSGAAELQLDIDRRFYGLAVIDGAIAVTLYVVLGLPRALPLDQAPLGILFTAIVAAQNYWRIDSRNTFRRTFISLNGMPIVMAAFFLAPGWFVIMLVTGPLVAWSIGAAHQWPVTLFNTASQAILAVVLAALASWIDPDGPLDSPRAIILVFAIWIGRGLVRLVLVYPYVWARYGSLTHVYILGSLRNLPRLSIPVMLGYLGAVAVTGAPWMIPPLLMAISFMYFVIMNDQRSRALEVFVGWLTDFYVTTNEAVSTHQIERALTSAFEAMTCHDTHAIAVSDPSSGVRWTGKVTPAIREGVASIDQLANAARHTPQKNPHGAGTWWVWSVDPRVGSYVVAAGALSKSGIRDVNVTGTNLVESARLAIDTVRQRERITADAKAQHRLARTDSVTGLPNRLAITEMISAHLAHESDPITVLKATPVGFRHTMDVLGSKASDAILVSLAERLTGLATQHDAVRAVGRDGEDAFLIVVVGDDVDVHELVERATNPRVDEQDVSVRRDLWVGAAASTSGHEIDAEGLLQRAGLARDRSEQVGMATVFGDADAEREARRMAIRLRLPAAIQSGAIRPVFQPQVDLADGRLVGCEILARWDDARTGPLSPREFIEIAELSNQIELLTMSLVNQAIETKLTDPTGRPVPLSVNLSAGLLANETFMESLVSAIGDAGRDHADFTFEVSESDVAANSETTIASTNRLHARGVRVAIDDFGTGNSTLSFLDRLAVAEIKIDRSLVSTVGEPGRENPVVRHLVRLCHELGLDAVAEGIETERERAVLGSLGCRRGQGYLLARPMDPDRTATWLRRGAQSAGIAIGVSSEVDRPLPART